MRAPQSQEAVETVFASWTELARAMSPLTPPALDDRTARLIERALRTHAPDELIEAMRGAAISRWHMAHGYWQLKHLLKDVGTITSHRDRWVRYQERIAQ